MKHLKHDLGGGGDIGLDGERLYTTYIMASRSHTLYIGVTGNLRKRVREHKSHAIEGFTATYRCDRLVWFERFLGPKVAIAREKQLKGWLRAKKIALIEKDNPAWVDLSEGWYREEGRGTTAKAEATATAAAKTTTRTTAGPSTS